jgi:hypothetical protein
VSFGLTGDTRQRFTDSVHFSERNRLLAQRRARVVREREIPRIRQRNRAAEMHDPTQNEIDVVVDSAIERDSKWKVAVQKEQWGVRNATMYGLALVAEQNEQIIDLLEELVARSRLS